MFASNYKILFLIILAFILRLSNLIAQNNDAKEKSILKALYFALNAGAESYNWAPEERKNGDIKFNTDGLQTYNSSLQFGLVDKDFFSIQYEGSFSNTGKQKEMLASNTQSTKSIESLSLMARTKPFLFHFLTKEGLAYFLLRSVLSFKYVYTQELYFGEAVVNRKSYFIPLDINITPGILPKEAISIAQGSQISFKTLFKDNEYTLNINTIKNYDIVVGYFQSSWERPSDYYTYKTTNDELVIMGYRYQANGFIIGYQPDNLNNPGLHFEFQIRGAGLASRSIKSSMGDLNEVLKKEDNSSGINYTAFYGNAWYNYQFSKLFFTLGALYSIRSWTREYEDDSNTHAIDKDYLLKVYLRLGFKY